MVITAKTINDIIYQVYNQQDLVNICNHYCTTETDSLDLFHEIILQLYNKPKKTIEMYRKGILKFYIIKAFSVIKNTSNNAYSKKRGNYHGIDKHKLIDMLYNNENWEEEEEIQKKKEELFIKLKKIAIESCKNKKEQFVIGCIFSLYYEDNLSYAKIAEKTMISKTKIAEYVNTIKKNINNKITDDDRKYIN